VITPQKEKWKNYKIKFLNNPILKDEIKKKDWVVRGWNWKKNIKLNQEEK
jgi:hypothetical protein